MIGNKRLWENVKGIQCEINNSEKLFLVSWAIDIVFRRHYIAGPLRYHINSCLERDSNLGPNLQFLLEFETWWLRPLSHHGWIFLNFVTFIFFSSVVWVLAVSEPGLELVWVLLVPRPGSTKSLYVVILKLEIRSLIVLLPRFGPSTKTRAPKWLFTRGLKMHLVPSMHLQFSRVK